MIGKALFFLVASVAFLSCEAAVTSIEASPSICPNLPWTVLVPHETDCQLYYKCDNGKPTLKTCPKKEHFQTIIQDCIPQVFSPCKSSTTVAPTTTTEEATPEPTTEEATPEPTTEEATPEPTTEEATPEPTTEEATPEPTTEEATPEPTTEEATPEPTTEEATPEPTTEEATTAAPSGPQCPAVDGEWALHLPHESDCTKFYKCSNGVAYLFSCPAPLHFNPLLQVCDWPQDAGCTAGQTTTTEATPEPTTEEATPEPTTEEATPEPTTEEATPEPTTEEATPEPTTEATTTQKPKDRCLSCTTQYWADEDDCRSYWKCVNRRSVKAKCPSNLRFNRKEGTCDKKDNVKCKKLPEY